MSLISDPKKNGYVAEHQQPFVCTLSELLARLHAIEAACGPETFVIGRDPDTGWSLPIGVSIEDEMCVIEMTYEGAPRGCVKA